MTEATSRSRKKPRRSHRKSKNGCSECKKRHIRCDEGRPECLHCLRAERICSFSAQSPGAYATPLSLAPSTPGESRTSISTTSPPELKIPSHEIGFTFTSIHMILLHHAEVSLGQYMGLDGSVCPLIKYATDSAFTAPYLLDQLLALSALHLATTDPSNSLEYYHQATKLQTRALELFNHMKEDISEQNCIPNFLFASLLGIHVLRETLFHYQDNLGTFIDAFVRYAQLHRGVRAVTNTYWDTIVQSDLEPLLYIRYMSAEAEKQEPGTETVPLKKFLATSKLGFESIKACQGALEWVQWVLDLSKVYASRADLAAHAVVAWPLLISREYIEILHQHQPEALVVFSYYAALLHRQRNFWVFGDSGSRVFHMISRNLGTFWHDQLAWPTQVLNDL